MTRHSSASKIAFAAAAICFAAAGGCALLCGMPFPSAAAAVAGAFFLFSYSEISRVRGTGTAHPLVSGEHSRAFFISAPVFILFSGFGWAAALAAGTAFILFESLFFASAKDGELFFPGLVSHAALTVLLLFLAPRGFFASNDIIFFLTGPLCHSAGVVAISVGAVFLLLSLFVFQRIVERLSPVSFQAAPLLHAAVKTSAAVCRNLSHFAVFLFCGAIPVPFNLFRAESPVLSRLSTLLLCLAMTFSAAAAVDSGFGAHLLAAAAVLSYIRFIIHQRRKRSDAQRQRSFMHCQRRSRS